MRTRGRSLFIGLIVFAAGFGVALLWRRFSPTAEIPARQAAPPVARPDRRKTTAPPSSRGVRREEGMVLARDPAPPARLAIVVDDLGNEAAAVSRVAALPGPIAGAVLPGLVRSRETAELLRASGKEVLLHLPMEPLDPRANPGPGTVRVAMTRAQIVAIVESDLADVPGADGVNNHMGSRASADRATMDAVFSVLKPLGLYFLDSRTTAFTVAVEEAGRLGISCASRSVFLDDVSEEAAIRAQLETAAEEARAQGAAIAIGHPHSATLAVLERALPELRAGGITLSRVSELLPPRHAR